MTGSRQRSIVDASPSPSERPIPAHPYRDTALLHGGLACLILILAVVSGGDVGRAAVIAGAYFLAATTWSWWRFHQRLRRAAESERSP
jgi:hypothetical protein